MHFKIRNRDYRKHKIKMISTAVVAVIMAVVTVVSSTNKVRITSELIEPTYVSCKTAKLKAEFLALEPPQEATTKAEEKTTVKKQEKPESLIISDDIIVRTDSEVLAGTDSITTLASFKNTGEPISELDVPDSLELNSKGIPKDFQYAISAKATAYHGDAATASGRKPMPGHIAVDPKEFPYGTELYIISEDGSYVYGYCIAADTGGFVKMGNTDVDLYMDNTDMCWDWGNRDIIIYVL